MNTKLNKSDYILLASYYLVAVVMQCHEYYNKGNSLLEFLIDIPLNAILSLVVIFLFLFWTIPEFVNKKKYGQFIFWGIITLAFFGAIRFITGRLTAGNKLPNFFNSLIYSISIGTEITAFPFAMLLTKKFYEGQTKLLHVQKQQKENELKILRSQLDPHFLFNNLNTLDALIDSDTTKAKEYINRLSLIYRYLIQTKDSEVMELSEELMLAENYIFLIETRFGNDYDVTIDKQASVNDKFIPTGALQTLLENVVKHNKVKNGNTIATTIVIDQNNLTITNQKSNLSSNNLSFGTGLENLKTRYKLLTDKEMVIKNLDDYFSVTIPIINLDA